MVKTILDNFCVKSGIFCPRCEEKLKKGQITDLDVKIIRRLVELEKEHPSLQEMFFHKAVEAGDMLAILVDRGSMGPLLGSGGRILKAVGEVTGKKIRVLGHGGDERQFLEDLFAPFSILTINTIWLPDGSTETKVILDGRRPKRMPIDFDVVKKLAHELRGLTLRIAFEYE